LIIGNKYLYLKHSDTVPELPGDLPIHIMLTGMLKTGKNKHQIKLNNP